MRAELFRMDTNNHKCPYGLKAKQVLEDEGFEIYDHRLKTREEVDLFKRSNDVRTTPQVFIDNKRVGGYEETLEYLGKDLPKSTGTSYQPIIVTFGMSFLMALALIGSQSMSFFSMRLIEYFVAFSMVFLAVFKLRDLYAFSNQFITYDLLTQKKMTYSYFYPFAEAAIGLSMLASFFNPIIAWLALIIGAEGAISVIKAVYIEKRKLKCACVGGDTKVPLGVVSLSENIVMMLMGTWMLL